MLSGKLSFHNYKILKKESALSEMASVQLNKLNKWNKYQWQSNKWLQELPVNQYPECQWKLQIGIVVELKLIKYKICEFWHKVHSRSEL